MLTNLHHTVLICPDIKAGIDAYEILLGLKASWRAQDEPNGIESAIFQLENTAIELIAPAGNSDSAQKLRDMMAGSEGRLTSLAFGTDDIAAAHHTIKRRGLDPSDITDGSSTDTDSGQSRSWKRLRIPDDNCAGIKTFIIEEPPESRLRHFEATEGCVTRLDHLVINTPNPMRAIAHYGAKLGLDLRLDRTIEAFNTRFLFFKIGGLVFEIISMLGANNNPKDNDKFYGLTWQVDDLDAAHKRLTEAGLNLSDIRNGRKPGSRVFTVREKTCGVPTLMIAHER